jgi:8-oxo-dGTP pyrophosphatase MutT (NUDIX family)
MSLREAYEEAGLPVALGLPDVKRTLSDTRHALARRTGGNPADMGWESQAAMLVPVEALATVLTNKNDAPIISATGV